MITPNIDKLTGLYTQKYFEERLKEELARSRRYKRPLTLLMFEIDYEHFMPEYNVRWAMVYTILKQFGSLLLSQLRNVDIAGRYGGEMFTIMLPETPLEGGKTAAERIRKVVEEHSFLGDNIVKRVKIALNGGVASFPIHGKTPEELLSSAHQGLLMARNQGGNKVVVCPITLYDETGEVIPETENKKAEEKEKETPKEPQKDEKVQEIDKNTKESTLFSSLEEEIRKKKEELKKKQISEKHEKT